MKLLNLLFATLVALISFSQNEIADTMGCNFGDPLLDVEYITHYTNQECTDTCTSTYWIEVLTADVDMIEITGPAGYYHVESGTNMTFASDSMLCPGDYVVVVYSEGMSQLCTDVFTIDTLAMLEYNLSTTNETGVGSCDGTATLDITGGVLPYIITWYDANQTPIPNENGLTIGSLCSGNYYYSVNSSWVGCCDSCPPCIGDSCGEVVFGGSGILNPFTILGPIDLQVLWTIDEMCPFMCDGGVELQATGGTGNYTYTIDWWSQNNGSFYGLCPQSYTATVTDDVGNIATVTFEIYPALQPWVDVVVMGESCDQSCDGYILMNDMMGEIIMWSIDGGVNYSSQNEYYNLCPGVYNLMGINYNGCEIYIGVYTIMEGSSPIVNNIDYTPASSPSSNDACITAINVTGGNPPYAYTIDGNSFSLPLCNLSPGPHTICVVDVNGCYSCEVFNITACDLQLYADGFAESCTWVCDGWAEAYVVGSTGNEVYSWYSSGGSLVSSNSVASDLCPDTYLIEVIDIDGCSVNEIVIVNAAAPINVEVNTEIVGCDYPCNVQATIIASGGTGTFLYSLDGVNWVTDNVFEGLCPDVYIAYAMDENDCVQPFTFIIEELYSEFMVETQVLVETTINPDCLGEILATAQGGAGAYTYSWNDCDGNEIGATAQLQTGFCPGEYYVTVTDALGCSVSSDCDTIFGENGISNIESMEVLVYPNPVSQLLNIEMKNNGNYDLNLIDAQGKLIYHQQFEGKSYQLNIGENQIVKGLYILELQSENKNLIQQIVIE